MFIEIQKTKTVFWNMNELLCDYWFRSNLRIVSTIFKWNSRPVWAEMQTLPSSRGSGKAFHCELMSTLQSKKPLVLDRTSRREHLVWVLEMFSSTVEQSGAHPDSRCPPGFCWPLAWDHTSFKHHVQPPASMSWPWPQQEKPCSQRCSSAAHSPLPPPTSLFTSQLI